MYCIPKLADPPSGTVSCSYGNRFGSNCSFTCHNGYRIRGSVHRQCEAEEGQPPAYWTGNETHCESKREILKPVWYVLRKYQSLSINQSITQSNSQLVSQSVSLLVTNQRTNKPTVNQSNQSAAGQSVGRSVVRSLRGSVVPWVGRRLINQSIKQSSRYCPCLASERKYSCRKQILKGLRRVSWAKQNIVSDLPRTIFARVFDNSAIVKYSYRMKLIKKAWNYEVTTYFTKH